jgi:peptidoglycan hydrolase-like protein with peptidoglycan-binding domain
MRKTLLGVGAVAAVSALGVWLAVGFTPRADVPAESAVTTTTAPVTRGEVVERVTIDGTLGYAGTYPVPSQLPAGILTSVPGPGTVVSRGESLFAVAGTQAILLYGTTPAYRDFSAGMTDGADVRQLEENLAALGMRPGPVNAHLDAATVAAIRRWQAARGLPAAQRTGSLPLGQVVFLPGPVRVGQAAATAGASVGPGAAVLSGTSTTRVVAADVTTDQQQLVHVGDRVRVDLPRGGPVDGTVTDIGRVAVREANAAPGTTDRPTVPVTVAVTLPEGVGDLDQAPVQIAITTARHPGVLLVPVTALLAKTGGGYQVRVVGGGLVDVEPGLFDDATALVEVGGAGLAEGMSVEVPA